MVDTLALEKLFLDVKTRFAAESPQINVRFGWREPARQDNQGSGGANRIVFVPGDPSGGLGKVAGAAKTGRNPRPLATLGELFTVQVWGLDATKPEDELAQYKATRLLYDAWYRAAYLACHPRFAVQSQQWLVEKLTRRMGAEIQAICSIEAMVPDSAWTEANPPPEQVTVTNKVVFPAGDFTEGTDTTVGGT